ncbi:uncharacterized protein LOC144452591 [Glandiceps talaboti]
MDDVDRMVFDEEFEEMREHLDVDKTLALLTKRKVFSDTDIKEIKTSGSEEKARKILSLVRDKGKFVSFRTILRQSGQISLANRLSISTFGTPDKKKAQSKSKNPTANTNPNEKQKN